VCVTEGYQGEGFLSAAHSSFVLRLSVIFPHLFSDLLSPSLGTAPAAGENGAVWHRNIYELTPFAKIPHNQGTPKAKFRTSFADPWDKLLFLVGL
jgi:hypothetical protein